MAQRGNNTRLRGAHGMNPNGPRYARGRRSFIRNATSIGSMGTPSTAGIPGSPLGSDVLVTRRRFLFGAVGVGVAAAVGVGAAVIGSNQGNTPADGALAVPRSSLTTLNDMEALDSYEDYVKQVSAFDLPYGSLVWVNDDKLAACLLPTSFGSPLAQVGVLNLTNGNLTIVLDKAEGDEDDFEIYDTRATSEGVVWTEANIMEGTWRVYAAHLKDGELDGARLLEEGDSTYETPSLAAVGNRAFWQVLPKVTDSNATDLPKSRLMGASFSRDGTEVVFESNRRMSTPPYATTDSVVITPRLDSASVYYQLTDIDAESGRVLETLTLPHAVAPLEGCYGDTGFMFSFPDIYSYEGAISNLGTYVPRAKPSNGDYSGAQWFSFNRTPTAPPAWCNGLLLVKSTYSICGIDLIGGEYFAIDVADGADSYGEYLASSGSRSTFVTYTNIDHTPADGERIYACRVRVWTTK